MKVSLLLGVEIHYDVMFEGLEEPPEQQEGPESEWCSLSYFQKLLIFISISNFVHYLKPWSLYLEL